MENEQENFTFKFLLLMRKKFVTDFVPCEIACLAPCKWVESLTRTVIWISREAVQNKGFRYYYIYDCSRRRFDFQGGYSWEQGTWDLGYCIQTSFYLLWPTYMPCWFSIDRKYELKLLYSQGNCNGGNITVSQKDSVHREKTQLGGSGVGKRCRILFFES